MTIARRHLHERAWQFKLTDEASENCAAYFARRASELAAALNCRLVAMSGVKVEERPGNASVVVGTALLENPRENVVRSRKASLSQRNSSMLLSGGRQC